MGSDCKHSSRLLQEEEGQNLLGKTVFAFLALNCRIRFPSPFHRVYASDAFCSLGRGKTRGGGRAKRDANVCTLLLLLFALDTLRLSRRPQRRRRPSLFGSDVFLSAGGHPKKHNFPDKRRNLSEPIHRFKRTF